MVSHVRHMVRHQPRGRVAIAYTKAGEYGVPASATPRVVDQAPVSAALRAFGEARGPDVHRRWADFLNLATATGSEDAGWRDTRRLLLDRTRYLWESVIRQDCLGHAHLNGYFVAAGPRYPGEGGRPPYHRLGLLQLFVDFFDQVKRRHGRPACPWWPVAALGVLALLVLLLGLH